MSRIIDRGLEEQSVLLTKMGELTYETLAISIRGYLHVRTMQNEIREMSDTLVAMAAKVEEEAFQLIARFQPVASDLRTIKSYMKIANDFARYGRYALDISVVNEQFNGLNECDSEAKDFIGKMSETVLGMVKISVDALRKHDIELAKSISAHERAVDKMYLGYMQTLNTQDNISPKCIVSSALMARYLERIADHATYVCESIVYIATGEKINLG